MRPAKIVFGQFRCLIRLVGKPRSLATAALAAVAASAAAAASAADSRLAMPGGPRALPSGLGNA